MKASVPIMDRILARIGKVIPLTIVVIAASISTSCGLLTNPDYEKMQGVWEAKLSDGEIVSVIVEGRKVLVLPLESNGHSLTGELKLISDTTPKQFDIVFPRPGGGNTNSNANTEANGEGRNSDIWQGIYELSEHHIKAAFAENDTKPRPTSFTSENTWEFEYKGKSENLVPADRDYQAGVATWHYWSRFNAVNKANSMTDPFANAQTPEQAIAACNQLIQMMQKFRRDISALQVSGVDPDVTAYVTEISNVINLLESVLRDEASVIRDAQNLAARSSSDGALASVIVDIFRGQPGATIDAFNAEAAQLRDRAREIVETANRGSAETAALGTKQIKLRSYLASRYTREFPEIKI